MFIIFLIAEVLIPGAIIFITVGMIRNKRKSDDWFMAGFPSLLLMVYGFALGLLVCDMTWGGMGWATPKFGPWHPGPFYADYLSDGWAGWIWVVIGLCLGLYSLKPAKK